jgi:hypothetical protein
MGLEEQGGSAGKDGGSPSFTFQSFVTSDFVSHPITVSIANQVPGSPLVSLVLEVFPSEEKFEEKSGLPYLDVTVTFEGYSSALHSSQEERRLFWTYFVGQLIDGGFCAESIHILGEEENTVAQGKLGVKLPIGTITTELKLRETIPPSSTLPATITEKVEAIVERDFLRYPAHKEMGFFERAFIGSGREGLPQIVRTSLKGEFDLLTESFKFEEFHTAILVDTKELRVQSLVENSLFAKEPVFLASECQRYLAETYGPGGLRHFLAIIDGLDEYGGYQTGTFIWDLNEHLARMGAKKKKGAYNSEDRKLALQIVNVFLSTKLLIYSKDKETKLTVKPFHEEATISERRRVTRKRNPETGQLEDCFDYERTRIQIHASDWYTKAFSNLDGSPQYTKFRRSLIQENHKKHPITIVLVPRLSREWRMNRGAVKRSVYGLLEWCNKNREKHKTRVLELLENELNYMQTRGYLGSWEIKNGKLPLSSLTNYDSVLILNPPSELRTDLSTINAKREKLLPSRVLQEETTTILNEKDFKGIVERSGLSDARFGEKIELSRQRVNGMKNGKVAITKEVSERVLGAFSSLL